MQPQRTSSPFGSIVPTLKGYANSFVKNLEKLCKKLNLSKQQGIGLLVVILLCLGMAYMGIWPFRWRYIWHSTTEYGVPRQVELTIFTPKELKKYDGSMAGQPIYLSLLGDVYDVTAGKGYYGGQTKFAALLGQDASAAFATGHFSQGNAYKDVSSCTDEEIAELFAWRDFFRTQKKYPRVGLLTDKYYNSFGWATGHLNYLIGLNEKALEWREKFTAAYQRYEPCSSSSIPQAATYEVSCPPKHYIRELFILKAEGQEIRRCVCVREDSFNDPRLLLYQDCGALAESCERHK